MAPVVDIPRPSSPTPQKPAKKRRILRHLTRQLGLDLSALRNLAAIPRFIRDAMQFRQAGGQIDRMYPILIDYKASAGTAKGHYFHQDLLVARFVHDQVPERHVDIGSRVDGFVAHVASFREIEVFDIRPLDVGSHRIVFRQADLTQLDSAYLDYADSVSCLHAIEHFGLGRYGDSIDPDGYLKAFANLVGMLKPGGTLYISFPIGKPKIEFNAHRIFHPNDALAWAETEGLVLQRFDFVDDRGALHLDRQPADAAELAFAYGCGIYTFEKAR